MLVYYKKKYNKYLILIGLTFYRYGRDADGEYYVSKLAK